MSDAWVRSTPGGATTAAAYMTLSSSDADRLVGVSVPTTVAASAQLHHTMETGSTDTAMGGSSTMAGSDMSGSDMGQMTMQEVSSIDIPAGGSATLSPGGYHIMLIDLVKPLTAGETVAITLSFEKAGQVVVQAPVRDS